MCCKFRHFPPIFTLYSEHFGVLIWLFAMHTHKWTSSIYVSVPHTEVVPPQVVINHFCQSNNKMGLLWFPRLCLTAKVVARKPFLALQFSASFTAALQRCCLTAVPHITTCVGVCAVVRRKWVCMSISYSHLNVLPGCRLVRLPVRPPPALGTAFMHMRQPSSFLPQSLTPPYIHI